MREAGRPIPAPSKAAVGKRTISVGNAVYQIIAEEAQRQGLNVDTIADSALIYGSSALLDRIGQAAESEKLEGEVPMP